jgi:hypothetical protein
MSRTSQAVASRKRSDQARDIVVERLPKLVKHKVNTWSENFVSENRTEDKSRYGAAR